MRQDPTKAAPETLPIEAGGRVREQILDTWIDALDWATTEIRILEWAGARSPRIVTVCNVHSVVTARSDAALREAINESDLATPDGMPVAWLIGHRRGSAQPRINGPDLTLRLCAAAAASGLVVAFYGSQPETLRRLREELLAQYPSLRIGAMISPPFRALAQAETDAYIAELNASGAGMVFVGLGCPKQEVWMAARRGQVLGVQLGVGAAFDYIAGTVNRPPVWMQRAGLEWLGRLLAEPRRLWRRYFVTNSVFLTFLLRELVTSRRQNTGSNEN